MRDDTVPLGADAEAAEASGGMIGRFVVERALGAGGMGVVVAARDPVLGRTVAIKILLPDASERADRWARLSKEAQAMARVQHPNVAAVYEVGTVGEQLFVAMELVDGQTLHGWLHERTRTPREALAMVVAAGRGLEAVHAAGLVHRDFKPDNVLVGLDGRPRVSDFGLVSARGAGLTSDRGQMTTISAAGTPAYMAPEHARGAAGDARSDQFSYCVTLYEALYGERPFANAAVPEQWRAPARPPGSRKVSKRLFEIVARGLSNHPEDRWPSMTELLAALERDATRRARRLGVIALIVIGVVALGGWFEARRSAAGREQRARELGGEVQRMRAMMRAAHLLPLHDIKPERDKLRAQLVRIEAQASELSGAARATAELALGGGYFTVGDNALARKHLEAAWEAGERNPDLAFDLGQLLARDFDRQVRHLPPDPAERARVKAELERTFRDPAIGYLRQAGGAADSSPELIEEIIAFAEARLEAAIAHGEAAFRELPTLYEAGLFVASSHARLGQEALRAGHREQVVAQLASAEAMYQRVVEIARSDDAVYKVYADHLGTTAWVRHMAGEDIAADLTRLVELARQGQAADSEATWPDQLLARSYIQAADNDARHQRAPRDHLRAGIAAAERAVVREPTSSLTLNFLGDAWGAMAQDWDVPHGIDPRPSLQKSIEAYDACNQISPSEDCFLNAGVSRAELARWQMAHGVGAAATIDAAVRNYQDGASSNPQGSFRAEQSICGILTEHARDRIEHGIDPQAILDRAEPHCAAARRDNAALADAAEYVGLFNHARALATWRRGGDPRPLWRLAQPDLEAALALDPRREDLRAELAALLAARADYLGARQLDARPDVARALLEARAALHANPDAGVSHSALAIASLAAARAGDRAAIAEGERAAEHALAIKADDGAALALAAELRLLDQRPGAVAEGQRLVERALALDPMHPRLILLRAGFERRSGSEAQAAADTRAALAAGPLLETDPLRAAPPGSGPGR
jgi:eukaryotic-like serine/threonine-protein kinase